MRFVALMLSVLLLAAPSAASPKPALSDHQIAAIRARMQKALTDLGVPGASVAIGLEGQVVWAGGIGWADLENHVPATSETRYRTASIGKSMTAVAAMKLAEDGRLDLDAPIQTYCARFPRKPWPITARDLISHTSGIRHYEGKPDLDAELYNQKHYDHASDALEIFENDPLVQQPGDDFHYTTWGYVTLGCVLEGATGQPYRELMQRLVFEPSGMASTRDDDPRAIIPNRARGYVREKGALKNSRFVDMSSKLAAGGWVTTAPDLVRYMNAFMDGRLVSAKTEELMLSPYRLPRGKGTVDNFGMGWFIDFYHGSRMAVYGGGTPQVSGFVMFVPEKKLAVAVLFNLEDVPSGKRFDVASDIANIATGDVTPHKGFFNSH